MFTDLSIDTKVDGSTNQKAQEECKNKTEKHWKDKSENRKIGSKLGETNGVEGSEEGVNFLVMS